MTMSLNSAKILTKTLSGEHFAHSKIMLNEQKHGVCQTFKENIAVEE